jgi:hypothetical protein
MPNNAGMYVASLNRFKMDQPSEDVNGDVHHELRGDSRAWVLPPLMAQQVVATREPL